jgi:hypothetical protein
MRIRRRTTAATLMVVTLLGIVAGCSSATPDNPTVAGGPSTSTTGGGAASSSSEPTGDTFPGVVPADVSNVTVTIRRPNGAPTVARSLPAALARHLAAVVNGLGPRKPAINCLARTGFTDTLRFVAGSQSWMVQLNPDPCGSVSVWSVGSTAPLQLASASRLDRAVLSALGLPADYGH